VTRADPRRVLLLAVVSVLSLCLAQTPTASASTRAERAATVAYLQADLSYLQSVYGNAKAGDAATQALVTGVGSECPQVLAGAPTSVPGSSPATVSSSATSSLTTRRLEDQIRAELEVALLRTWISPSREATQTFLAQTNALRWGRASLRKLARERANGLEHEVFAAVPDTCTDARAFAASAYTTLTPSTLALSEGLEHEGASPDAALVAQLKPYESKAARRLAALLAHFTRLLSNVFVSALASTAELEAALGLRSEEPILGDTPIGSGHTAAGTSFTVNREAGGGASGGGECELPLNIAEGGVETSICAQASDVGVPEIRCEAGLLPIHLVTPAGVASASLLLSDGRRIASPVLTLPLLSGKQLGYYYQRVRGPSPIPVSLTELDGEGKPLAVIELRRLVGCTKHPVKLLAGGPIAHGTVLHGPSYTITAGRYSYLGKIEHKVSVIWEHEGGASGFGAFAPRRVILMSSSECTKHPATLCLALLPSAGDTLFARTSDGLLAAHAVTLAANVHLGAKVAYEAFTTLPSELLVRDRSGRQVFGERLSRKQREEKCTPGSSGSSGITVGHAR
jgi:hypothetical protein